MADAIQIAFFRKNRLIIEKDKFNKILDKVGDRPLAVISVNGPMRTGKSFILGYFLRYLTNPECKDWFDVSLNQEFPWKNSADRQTTGIYAWSEPFLFNREDEEMAVLLLDTQGSFDNKTTTNENSLIFALSCLLSSTLVYNIKNGLSEDILQFLYLFINYAKMSAEEDSTEETDYTEEKDSTDEKDSEPLSKLVFLIRDWPSPKDFAYGYHCNASPADSRNYKKKNLDMSNYMASEARMVREEILSSFTSVDCCLMPYPGKRLVLEDKVDQLDEDFRRVIIDLLPRLLHVEELIPKQLGGKEVTGNDLKSFIEEWADMFDSTKIPPILNVVESTIEVQNHNAATMALKFYNDAMQTLTPDDTFEQEHSSKCQEALSMFDRSKRFTNHKIQNKFRKSLKDDIEKAHQMYIKINSAQEEIKICTEACKALKFYEDEMGTLRSNDQGMPKADLEKLHKDKRQKALDMFGRVKSSTDTTFHKAHYHNLKVGIDRAFQWYIDTNQIKLSCQEYKAEIREELTIREAYWKAFNFYKDGMIANFTSGQPKSEADFQGLHESKCEVAMEMFRGTMCTANSELKETLCHNLKDEIERVFKEYTKINSNTINIDKLMKKRGGKKKKKQCTVM